MSAQGRPAWSGRTRGGYFGNWLFITTVRLFGLRAAYCLLIPVAAYFVVAAPESTRACSDYLRRVLGPMPFWRRLAALYRQYYAFGVTLLDRLALLGGQRDKFKIEFAGGERVRAALDEGKGVILLGAHMGNSEIAGQMLERHQTPVNIVWLQTEGEKIRKLMERALAGRNFRIIPVDAHFTQVIDVLQALRRGEIVAMHGDRAWGGRAARVPFLGEAADFPIGAYALAAISGAPVVQVFALREGVGRYRMEACEPIRLEKPARSRRDALYADCAALYASRIEERLKRHPYQWHNFYAFWPAQEEAAKPPSVPPK